MFGALKVDLCAEVIETRCVGCGVCVAVCPQGALGLVRRTEENLPPANADAWRSARLSLD
jgi:Fe-S-cluster-containing hydrogenase component 2